MTPFYKAEALGNDFIIFEDCPLSPTLIKNLANRRTGIGCDQVILVSRWSDARPSLKFYNADGSKAEACGNGTRCVVRLLSTLTGQSTFTLQADKKTLTATVLKDGSICLKLPAAQFPWKTAPPPPAIQHATAVHVGNPHLVFFTADWQPEDIETLGPEYEAHPLFPNRINVSLAFILDPKQVRLVVWERGSGPTPACGTAACAVVAGGHQLGLLEKTVTVHQPGGPLSVEIQADQTLHLTGEAHIVYQGNIDFQQFSG